MNREASLETWAIAGIKDDTGSGRLSFNLMQLLYPARQLVTPSYRLAGQAVCPRDVWVPHEASDLHIEQALCGLEVLIVLEDQPIHHRIVHAAKNRGITVHQFALWEWFVPYYPIRRLYDKIICPNRFCRSVLQRFGFHNTVLLTCPVELGSLPERLIFGPAKTFVHNAGKPGGDDRKATLLTREAFQRVRTRGVSFIVRSQSPIVPPTNDPRVTSFTGNLSDYRDLYREGEVVVQPSKAEGIGLSILEAMACGLPVLTTKYPPMNEYISHPRMLVATHWGKKPAQQANYIPQAHLKIPRVDALVRRIEWCATHDMAPFSRRNRAWALKTFNRDRLRADWIRALSP